MIRTQVSLEEADYRAAQREAKRQGISLAELVRRGVALMLVGARSASSRRGSRDDRPWMRHAGSLRSGDETSSQTVDEVVYGRERP